MVLFIALAGAEVSPAQGDSAEALGSSRAGSAQGWEMHQCLLPPITQPHRSPSPPLPKVLRVALFASLARGERLRRGFCSNTSVCAQGVPGAEHQPLPTTRAQPGLQEPGTLVASHCGGCSEESWRQRRRGCCEMGAWGQMEPAWQAGSHEPGRCPWTSLPATAA